MSQATSSTDLLGRVVFFAIVVATLSGCSDGRSFSATSAGASAGFSSQLTTATSGGNGDYYGGKPVPGIYQRFNATSMIEKLKITENSAELLNFDVISGITSFKIINLHDIEFAAYFPGHVGIGDGLYTMSALSLNEGPSEVWCRKPGSTAQVGYDLSIEKTIQDRFYRAKFSQTILAKGVYVGEKSAVVEQVTEDRTSADRVHYRADGFELEIRFDTFKSVSGKFQGRLRFNQDAQVDTPIDCRIGGALDSQLPNR